MAGAIRAAAEDTPRRREKLLAARRRAEAHDWPLVAARFLSLHADLWGCMRGLRPSPAIPPDFVSTHGNWLGMEVR